MAGRPPPSITFPRRSGPILMKRSWKKPWPFIASDGGASVDCPRKKHAEKKVNHGALGHPSGDTGHLVRCADILVHRAGRGLGTAGRWGVLPPGRRIQSTVA